MKSAAKTFFPERRGPAPVSAPPRKTPSPLSCPKCRAHAVGVYDSRLTYGSTIRRRRYCEDCDHRWTTYEVHGDAVDAIYAAAKMRKQMRLLCVSIQEQIDALDSLIPAEFADWPADE